MLLFLLCACVFCSLMFSVLLLFVVDCWSLLFDVCLLLRVCLLVSRFFFGGGACLVIFQLVYVLCFVFCLCVFCSSCVYVVCFVCLVCSLCFCDVAFVVGVVFVCFCFVFVVASCACLLLLFLCARVHCVLLFSVLLWFVVVR